MEFTYTQPNITPTPASTVRTVTDDYGNEVVIVTAAHIVDDYGIAVYIAQ